MELRILLFIIMNCLIVMVAESQKSQHLVLSESRKTGVEGTLLQVNCTAHVTSALDSLKWIPGHDGQSDIQQVYLTNTTVVMTISSLDGSDAGRYKCLLVMADGREETAEFELMVRRKESNSATCSITQFKCKRTKHCIFLRYRCDGKDDCGDGSDEDCESNPCLNKFRCNNTRCIDNLEVCNHVDNCGDLSDEGPSCFIGKFISTTQASSEDNQFGWLKITMSTIIASTVGVVILISFIVIVVFRIKMKRQREQRIARALEGMYRHGESREATSSGQGDEAPSDQRPFLPSGSHHYGNIIVNVNNGVQYLPGYDYSLFVAVPPPYSECAGAGAGCDNLDLNAQPPPYSTIDRSSMRQQTSKTGCSDDQPAKQNISVSSVQSCLGGMRGSDHVGSVLPGSIDRNGFTNVNAYPGQLCQGVTQVQDLESLSGITPRFLQSLLGSHCENISAVSVASNKNNFQPLPEPFDGWSGRSHMTAHVQQANVGTDQSESQTENSSELSHTSRSRPASDPAFNSTQTSQHKSVISSHVTTVPDTSESKQDTDKNLDQNNIVYNINSEHSVASLHCEGMAEHDSTDVPRSSLDSSAAQDMSSNADQISVCGAGFSDIAGTYPAVSSVHELCSNSCLQPSATVHSSSDVDDSNVPLLRSCQSQDFLLPAGDGTCLIRKHGDRTDANKPRHVNSDDMFEPLLPSRSDVTSAAAAACSDLVSHVSYGNENNKSRPGHLSVHKGQILLHTDEGILAGESPLSTSASSHVRISPGHRPSVDGEFMVRDENLMFQASYSTEGCHGDVLGNRVPDGNPLCDGYGTENTTDLSDIQSSIMQNNDSDTLAVDTLHLQSSFGQSSDSGPQFVGNINSIPESTDYSVVENKNRFSGELNVKDGDLILEAPKHTPSSLILSHLQGAYAAEQQDAAGAAEDNVEPVLNTKRPVGVVTRPPLPKFNSDFVLPYRNKPS